MSLEDLVVRGHGCSFYLEPRHCGELDTGLEDDRVWMTCTCGAMIRAAFAEMRGDARACLAMTIILARRLQTFRERFAGADP